MLFVVTVGVVDAERVDIGDGVEHGRLMDNVGVHAPRRWVVGVGAGERLVKVVEPIAIGVVVIGADLVVADKPFNTARVCP